MCATRDKSAAAAHTSLARCRLPDADTRSARQGIASAAITARLAHGDALAKAVAIASDFVGRGIASAPGFGDVGPLNHWA